MRAISQRGVLVLCCKRSATGDCKRRPEVIDKLKDKYRIEESENGIRPIYNESSVCKNPQEMMQMPNMPRTTSPSPQMNRPMQNQTHLLRINQKQSPMKMMKNK